MLHLLFYYGNCYYYSLCCDLNHDFILLQLIGRAPNIVKIFINQTVSLDFDKADSKQATQELEYVINFNFVHNVLINEKNHEALFYYSKRKCHLLLPR